MCDAAHKIFLIFVFIFLLLLLLNDVCADPDEFRDSVELIASRGFIPEVHHVTTEDGFVLTLHRIINPYIPPWKRSLLKPVFLQHGIACSSKFWLINSQGRLNLDGVYVENDGQIVSYCDTNINATTGRTLAFVLAACGYDVWLGNSRGTSYSWHKKYNIYSPKYWKFTYYEMGIYDLPASFEYILFTTDKSTLSYIGHSQGNTMMFVLLSTKPEFAAIINKFIALSPVTFWGHTYAILRILAPLGDLFLGLYPTTFPQAPNIYRSLLMKTFCHGIIKYTICNTLAIVSSSQLNASRTNVYLSQYDMASTIDFRHYVHDMIENKFRHYDYGPIKNYVTYGNIFSPDFPLEDIILENKIAIFYGDDDYGAPIEDVMLLRSRLKVNLLDFYQVPIKGLWHNDYVYGTGTGIFINPRILLILSL